MSRFIRRAAVCRFVRGLGNPGATSSFAKNTSFAPGSASGSPAVPLGTLSPATLASAPGSYSSAAPGSVLARLQAKWRQEAENKRQKKNEEAKEKEEKSRAELKRKVKGIEQAHKLAKKEKKDAARKKAQKQRMKAEAEQKRLKKEVKQARELAKKKRENKKNKITAEKKEAALKRKVKKVKREKLRLRRKAKIQHRRAAVFHFNAPFYRHDNKVALLWISSSFESVSPAGAVPGSFPGFLGGSDGYVSSNVDMLFDRSSSFFSPIFRTRARAARRGGAGSSKARRSSSPVPGQIRFNPSPRASKRTDPKGGKRVMPCLNYVQSALNGNSIS
jgi:hypothetical protein